MPAIQEKVVEDLKEELSKEVVWPNRLILPLSSAADARQVREMQQVSGAFSGVATSTRRVSLRQASLCERPSKEK